MPYCVECNGNQFTVESGVKVCNECGTVQASYIDLEEDNVWEEGECRYQKSAYFQYQNEDSNVTLATDDSESKETTTQDWTTFEIFNDILSEWCDILIKMGVTKNLKVVLFNLWFAYLKKRKISICNETLTEEMKNDFLKIGFSERDCRVIFNVEASSSKKRKPEKDGQIDKMKKKLHKRSLKGFGGKNSKFLTEELSKTLDASKFEVASDEDKNDEEENANASVYEKSFVALTHDNQSVVEEDNISTPNVKVLEKKHKVRNFLSSNKTLALSVIDREPNYLTFPKLLAFVYLALRLCDADVSFADLLRFCRQGKIPYNSAALLFEPGKIKASDHLIFDFGVPSANVLLNHSMTFALYIDLVTIPLQEPKTAIKRWLTALHLPDNLVKPMSKLHTVYFPHSHQFLVAMELAPLLILILVMKKHFCLDDHHEMIINEAADKINRILETEKQEYRVFSFRQFQKYMNKLIWWVNRVDLTSKTLTSKLDRCNINKYKQDYWTREVLDSLPRSKEAPWRRGLIDDLAGVCGDSVQNLAKVPTFFPNSNDPFTELLDHFITKGYLDHHSEDRTILLKIAKELKNDPINHTDFFWLNNPNEINSLLAKTKTKLEIVPIPLSDPNRSYHISSKKSANITYIYLPDPADSFLPSVSATNSFFSSSLQWLVKMLALAAETNPNDLLMRYVRFETYYLKKHVINEKI